MSISHKSRQNILYEVVPIRLFLIISLVFYHAFAIFSGAWKPINCYPEVKFYAVLDKLSYACLLETFVFISGYILGYQVRLKGRDSVLNFKKLLISKFKRLLVPSILFSIIYLYCFGDMTKPILLLFYDILNGVGHMWFLPMLFWCFIFIPFVERINMTYRWTILLILALIYFSVLPLPFRFGVALYYFLFFYVGYLFQKNQLITKYSCTKIKLFVSLIAFLGIFTLKYLFDDSYIYNNLNGRILLKIVFYIMQTTLKAVCASLGVFLLLHISLIFLNKRERSIWNNLLLLSECSFGVYLFQQFILQYFNRSNLPYMINPYVYPWVSFVLCIVISVFVTFLFRKTKIGKQLI